MIRWSRFRCIAGLLLLALPGLGAAETPAPAPAATSACVDGERPTEPYSEHDKWGMQRYDAELQRYKRDHDRYLRCIERDQGRRAAAPDSMERKVQDALDRAAPPLPAPTPDPLDAPEMR